MLVMMTMLRILLVAQVAEALGNRSSLVRGKRARSCGSKYRADVTVCVKTSDDDNYGIKDEQGTDDRVYIRFYGDICFSGWFELESNQNNFEPGYLNCFDLNIDYLGPRLLGIGMTFQQSGTNVWLLDYVAVEYQNGCRVFVYRSWLYDQRERYRTVDRTCPKAESSRTKPDATLLAILCVLGMTSAYAGA